MFLQDWFHRQMAREIDNKLMARTEKEKAAAHFTLESLFLTGKEIVLGSGGGVTGAYGDSWVAYSCMKRLATDASGIPLKFLRDPTDLDSDLPDSHPTVRLFKNPNPYFTTSEFIQSIVTWLQYRGEFFVIFDDPFRPTMMYNYTEPLNWRPILEGPDVKAWEYRHGQEHRVEAPENMIHHRFIDPKNPHRGQPPLRAAATAYGIDTGADTLQLNIVERGGERAVLYQSQLDVTKNQRNQALEMLRARRGEKNKVGRDVLLPNGISVVDPKFIEDDLAILSSQKMQPDKICAVYGLSKSLLGIEDIDKYATFAGRIKVYFKQTLIPQLSGIEDAFDRYFVDNMRLTDQCYVRFNYENVEALQDDIGEQFDIAGKAHAAGLPWSVCNERFKLGLDVTEIPGAETVMVSTALAPLDQLIASWDNPPEPPPPPPPKPEPKAELTNAMIRKRARDPRSYLQRQLRLFKLEKELRYGWRKMIEAALSKAGSSPASAEKQRGPTKKAAKALVPPIHEKAALEGEISILDLVAGKMDDQTLTMFKARHTWSEEVGAFLQDRENLISGDVIDDLFDDVKEASLRAVKDGKGVGDVRDIIKGRFHAANGGINRAVTIARTEVGSAYNFSRFAEMKEQDFRKHEWLTAGDEKVRAEDPFNHVACDGKVRSTDQTFPNGLHYPMESGGEAGNVINCRCQTIPLVEV